MDAEQIRAYVERSTREQGVPFYVTDPLTIAKVATLLGVTSRRTYMAERAGNAGNARGGRHKKSPRGGAPVKARAAGKSQALRRERRLANPRVRSALAHAAAERARIESLIDRTPVVTLRPAVEVTVKRVQGGKGDPVPVVVERTVPVVDLKSRAEGSNGWSLGQARLLFADGYSLERVVARTGWGGWWFLDLLAEDGYARTLPVLREAA